MNRLLIITLIIITEFCTSVDERQLNFEKIIIIMSTKTLLIRPIKIY